MAGGGRVGRQTAGASAQSGLLILTFPREECDSRHQSRFSTLRGGVGAPLSCADAPAAVGPYNQAIKVGDLLFCSGSLGLDPSTGKLVSIGGLHGASFWMCSHA